MDYGLEDGMEHKKKLISPLLDMLSFFLMYIESQPALQVNPLCVSWSDYS